ERADLALEIGAAGALDGCEFEHLPTGDERRQVLLALLRALQDEQPLQVEGRAHDSKKILRHRRGVIRAQRWPYAMVERLLDRRHAVAHRHFQRRRQRDAATGLLAQPPSRDVEDGAMDEQVLWPPHAGATKLQR